MDSQNKAHMGNDDEARQTFSAGDMIFLAPYKKGCGVDAAIIIRTKPSQSDDTKPSGFIIKDGNKGQMEVFLSVDLIGRLIFPTYEAAEAELKRRQTTDTEGN